MTANEIFWLSAYIAMSGSIPIAVCCLIFYKNRPPYIKVLGYYGGLSICFIIGQNIVTGVMINWIGNIWTLSELVLFAILYFLVTNDKTYRNWIILSCLAYILFYAVVFIFFPSYSFSYIRTGRDLILILYALFYFFYLLKKLPEENLLGFSMFWINTAVIFFFSGTFILSFFRDYIVTVLKDDTSGFWAFRNFFRFAFCLVLAYAGWLDLRLIWKKQPIR